ncbi:dynamin family protein [Mesobacillus maritimus]|uniref:Dynamin family GTPase n=1 Tax=Mesobacillus maritimus TaxID=1643336 RepID=A0ABS7K324_9BACI|nr:dynamin family protein [Mesobacillus maritimus]MBY0096608.1 dynamin family GTPase [Mesobacillus maritimus]
MGLLVAQKDKQLLGKIMKLHHLFTQHEDLEASAKSKELGRKTLEREFAIAFCGHFSAGKSSMINSLIGEDILPSSPIPTSANLVKVKSGEEYARVYFKEGKPRLYPAPYDYDTVKNYCKDGDQIESLEISHKGSGLLNDVVVMDTPGIDSADDAHRIATESALHLADLVLYVMDYNHVQSELNFLFTKQLTEAGKELYLVVNMIDKHREEELRFEDFKKSVVDSFAAWGVHPKGIYFTSLKKPGLKHNQFNELQQFLQGRIQKREEMLPESVYKSLVKVSEDHVKLLTEKAEDQILVRTDRLQEVPEANWAQLTEEHQKIKSKINELKSQENKVLSNFTNGMEDILKNAYLMPFKTRELAESYLTSMQPDFKVGLFFAKQKTLQERADRLELFYLDLAEKVQAQLDWHLKEFLLTNLKEQGIENDGLRGMAQSFKVNFPKELLQQTIKTGAVVSGDYVLNYTNDVAEAVKKQAREQLRIFRESYLDAVRSLSEKEMAEASKQEVKLRQLVDSYEELLEIQESLSIRKKAVFEVLFGDVQSLPHLEEAASLFISEIDEEVVLNSGNNILKKPSEGKASKKEEPNGESVSKENLENYHAEVNKLVEKLRVTADEVESLPGLKRIRKELIDKSQRLENQQFTVALFGAFSAGKSSFANALIGENLLPVSPNPTTAAINKIKPIDDEHPHGTVLVKVKDNKQLLEEINRSLKLFNLESADFPQAIDRIDSIQLSQATTGAAEKLHHSFLRAFSTGYYLFENRMGNVFSTDLDSFRGYVADEEKSCFVEWIEVYYDCELTREGISLVDTPGADSINARHTGVAFDYIKNSDAILFVTYYNHAFSRADREFLIQLGRVKDTFELDKMFFIVNAIDLANSEKELEDVLEYVTGQLVQYGIKNPHLHPVSSLQALKEKTENKGGNSRFDQFEQSFYSFISDDLMKMAMDSAEAKWQLSLQTLGKLLQSAEEGQEAKEEKLAALEEERKTVLQHIKGKDTDFLQKQLIQESDELVYYIKQRVFLRFSDFFRESFNPSVIKDDGRDLKQALQSALNELIETIGFDFLQEMRATTLRVESFITKLLEEFQNRLSDELQKMSADLAISKLEITNYEKVDFNIAFKELDKKIFRKALGMFKNPKAFFEKDEKRAMSEEIERLLQLPADEYLQVQGKFLREHYLNALEKHLEHIRNEWQEQTEEYYTGVKSTLSTDFPIEELKNTYNKVKSLS